MQTHRPFFQSVFMHSNALQPHVTSITVDSRDTDYVLPVFQNLTHWNFFQTQSYKVKLTDIGDFLMWCRVASSNIRHKEVSRLKRWNSKWFDKSQGSKSFSSFLLYRYHLHLIMYSYSYILEMLPVANVRVVLFVPADRVAASFTATARDWKSRKKIRKAKRKSMKIERQINVEIFKVFWWRCKKVYCPTNGQV